MLVESKSSIGPEAVGEVAPREVTKRSVFVSHTHADRELASKLKSIIDQVYSGVVRAFISSDPTPGGGIQPGDQWFQRIQSELDSSEAVWVIATKASVNRPWIYWEAGLGRAMCPGGVIILRVGLAENEVYSPLNQFQSYDGTMAGAGGIKELLGKVGERIGMTIANVLLEAVTDEWLSFLKGYQPKTDEVEAKSIVSAEEVSQMASLIARLETAVSSLASLSPRRRPEVDVPLPFPPTPAPQLVPLRARIERNESRQRTLLRRREMAVRMLGTAETFFDDPQDLFDALASGPESATVEFTGLDDDGDAGFAVEGDGVRTIVYLRGRCLLDFKKPTVVDRFQSLLGQLEAAIEEAVSVSTNGAEPNNT